MDFTATEIHRLVKEIRTAGRRRAESDAAFDAFRQRYPKLFAMACDPAMSMDLFDFMITQLDRRQKAAVAGGDTAAAARDDTDLAVGQELVDVFVKGQAPGASL